MSDWEITGIFTLCLAALIVVPSWIAEVTKK